jgi:hypothetical protein
MVFGVSSSATVQRRVSWWVRTQNAVANASVTLNSATSTVSVGDQVLENGSSFDYYLITAYILGAGTAEFSLIQTSATGSSVAVMGAAVYE